MSQGGARTARERAAPLQRARRSAFLLLVAECATWPAVVAAAVILRHEFVLARVDWPPALAFGAAAAALHAAIGYAFGLYSGRFRPGSFEEGRALALAVLVEAALLEGAALLIGLAVGFPRSALPIAFPIALLVMLGIRIARRLVAERRRAPRRDATPALIAGAGTAGELIVRNMKGDPDSPLRPVGLLDDDPAKRRLQLHGVPVLGGTGEVERVARETGAEVLALAIAGADAALVRRLTDAGTQAGLRVMVIPTVQQLVSGSVSVADLRSVAIEDLLGRHPVDTRVEDVAGYVTGRRVLVTGAGGSIGTELCRQLSRFGPSELVMLDRDETGLQQAQLAVSGHGLLDTGDLVLADIREADRVDRVFAERRPEVVFHAAALKHLPVLEQHPEEAWKTNVIGTLNVLRAARAAGVRTFVNISTDKAANPTSVLGRSKRVAERITAWAAEATGERYLSVRFGNVIGSRGSMLPTFRALIESGGPITVTHPEATRYFMTIPEACQLVIQAGGIGRPGEALILDMGEPVRILDVAERMIAMSGKRIEIRFTGLREGEKLHEELAGADEALERPFHPQISHTRVEPLAPERLDAGKWRGRGPGGAPSGDARGAARGDEGNET